VIRPQSSVFAEEPSNCQKQTTRINIDSTLISWRGLGGGRLEDQVLAMLRGQLADIILGTVFLFIASQMWGACSIAAIRRQSGRRLFIWLGIWSAIYGIGLLAQSPAVVAALPLSIQRSVPYVTTGIGYLTLVP